MTRYFCHENPDTLILETRVVNARPGAVPGTGDYIAHMDYVVNALAKAFAGP